MGRRQKQPANYDFVSASQPTKEPQNSLIAALGQLEAQRMRSLSQELGSLIKRLEPVLLPPAEEPKAPQKVEAAPIMCPIASELDIQIGRINNMIAIIHEISDRLQI